MLSEIELEFAQLNHRWKLLCDLFVDDSTVDLMNKSGSHVFTLFQKLVIDDVILCNVMNVVRCMSALPFVCGNRLRAQVSAERRHPDHPGRLESAPRRSGTTASTTNAGRMQTTSGNNSDTVSRCAAASSARARSRRRSCSTISRCVASATPSTSARRNTSSTRMNEADVCL